MTRTLTVLAVAGASLLLAATASSTDRHDLDDPAPAARLPLLVDQRRCIQGVAIR